MANHLRRSKRRNHDQTLPSRDFFSSLLEHRDNARILPDSETGGDAFISVGRCVYGQGARLVHAVGSI
jgi:hypothetical protein